MRLTSIIRSAEVSKKLVKPKMRGLLIDGITRTILEGFVLGAVVSAGWYFWAMKPRKENYANFYKNYDAEADYERMRKAGVFTTQFYYDEGREALENKE